MDNTLEQEITGSMPAIDIPVSKTPDLVEQKYKIYTDEPITELHNDCARYFIARSVDNNEEFFAIILEKHNIYHLNTIKMLKNVKAYSCPTPIAYEITFISAFGEEFLSIIIKKYDYTNNLIKFIHERGPLSESSLNESLIKPFNNLINFCEKNNIELGNICPRNIIAGNDNSFFLREFYITPPHYLQERYFLAPEISQCIKFGRITGDVKADIYSLGLVILFGLLGNDIWNRYEEAKYDLLRLETSTFNLFVSKLKIDKELKDFLKSILNDDPSQRINSRNIIEWLEDKTVKVIANESADAITPIVFNEGSYFSTKALAYAMFAYRDQAEQLIIEDRFSKWIQRSLSKKKMAEKLNEAFFSSVHTKFSSSGSEKEDFFLQILLILDSSVIRMDNIAMTPLSIPVALVYSLVNKRRDILDFILKVFNKNLLTSNTEIKDYYYKFIEFFQEVENSFVYYNPQSQGFSLERVMYQLNPNLPCLSSNLAGKYVSSLFTLFEALDALTAKNPQAQINDKHVINYVSNLLNLKKEPKLTFLTNYPALMQSPSVVALSIFALAQQQIKITKMDSFGHVLALRVNEVFSGYLHNVKLKQTLKRDLINAGKTGNLGKMLNLISDTNLIENDFKKYKQALKNVTMISEQILALQNRDQVNKLGIFLGQRVTVLISYFLVIVITLFLIFNRN